MVLENAGPLDMTAGLIRAGVVDDETDDFSEFEIYFAIHLAQGNFGVPDRVDQNRVMLERSGACRKRDDIFSTFFFPAIINPSK